MPSSSAPIQSQSAPLQPSNALPTAKQSQPVQGSEVAAPKQTAALMERLFGSDGDEDSDSTDDKAKLEKPAFPHQAAAEGSKTPQQKQQSPLPASAVVQSVSKSGNVPTASHRATDLQGARSGSAQGTSQETAASQHLPSSASLGQRLVDPAAPKRSISFSDSMRRRQSSSAVRRRQTFNDAADAAISEALSQRNAATAATQATELASQSAELVSQSVQDTAVVQPGADVSTHVTPVSVHHQTAQPYVSAIFQPDQAAQATATDQMQRSSSTQALPTGRTGSGLGSEVSASTGQQGKQEEGQDAPKVITRSSQAEVAPKLKMGSRLAASMAKLAASKNAGNAHHDSAAPAAAVTLVPPKADGKKSTIPEDVKRALLAKVPDLCNLFVFDAVYYSYHCLSRALLLTPLQTLHGP